MITDYNWLHIRISDVISDVSEQNPLEEQVDDELEFVRQTLEDSQKVEAKFSDKKYPPTSELAASEDDSAVSNKYSKGGAEYTRNPPENLPDTVFTTFSQDQEDPAAYVVDEQCDEGEKVLLGELLLTNINGSPQPYMDGSIKLKGEKTSSGGVRRYLEVDPWHIIEDEAVGREIAAIEHELTKNTDYDVEIVSEYLDLSANRSESEEIITVN